jgi:hypothetical protein
VEFLLRVWIPPSKAGFSSRSPRFSIQYTSALEVLYRMVNLGLEENPTEDNG